MYFVFKRTSRHGYHVHFGVIKEREPEVAYARFAALAPDRIVILQETDDWKAVQESLNRARGTKRSV